MHFFRIGIGGEFRRNLFRGIVQRNSRPRISRCRVRVRHFCFYILRVLRCRIQIRFQKENLRLQEILFIGFQRKELLPFLIAGGLIEIKHGLVIGEAVFPVSRDGIHGAVYEAVCLGNLPASRVHCRLYHPSAAGDVLYRFIYPRLAYDGKPRFRFLGGDYRVPFREKRAELARERLVRFKVFGDVEPLPFGIFQLLAKRLRCPVYVFKRSLLERGELVYSLLAFFRLFFNACDFIFVFLLQRGPGFFLFRRKRGDIGVLRCRCLGLGERG